MGALAADFYLRTGLHAAASIRDEQPERGRVLFTEPEIRALVAYVASLGQGPADPDAEPAAGQPRQGLELFTEHCAGCHQIVAAGRFVHRRAGAAADKRDAPRQIAEAVRIGPYLMPQLLGDSRSRPRS